MERVSRLQSRLEPKNSIASDMIIRSGGFEYRYVWDWAKLPPYLERQMIVGVMCDHENNVYALNRSGVYPIVVFDPEGNVIKELCKDMPCGRVHGASITRDDLMWVADDSAHVVRKIDLDGNILQTLGTFNISSDTGYDTSAPANEQYKTIKRAGPPFNRPTKAMEAPNGDIYVSDGYGNAAVHRFRSNGELVKTWGGPGTEPGHFLRPHGIWCDAKNRIWVADREGNQLQIFDEDGNFLKKIPNLMFPTDFWSDGTYMYVGELDGRITIIDMDCNMLAQLGYPGSQLCTHAISGDSKGNLYACVFRGENYLAKLERI